MWGLGLVNRRGHDSSVNCATATPLMARRMSTIISAGRNDTWRKQLQRSILNIIILHLYLSLSDLFVFFCCSRNGEKLDMILNEHDC